VKSLLFAPAAIADIEAIWDYSAHHWMPDQADSTIDAIRDACTALASGQAIGRRHHS
jgi:toxin ParE1/3/4